jgi:hypothetical protein
VIPDPNIFRAAKLLINQHGGAAPIRALERAEEPADKSDLEGFAGWRRILEAIDELQRGPARR